MKEARELARRTARFIVAGDEVPGLVRKVRSSKIVGACLPRKGTRGMEALGMDYGHGEVVANHCHADDQLIYAAR